jgi:hypothetical protein
MSALLGANFGHSCAHDGRGMWQRRNAFGNPEDTKGIIIKTEKIRFIKYKFRRYITSQTISRHLRESAGQEPWNHYCARNFCFYLSLVCPRITSEIDISVIRFAPNATSCSRLLNLVHLLVWSSHSTKKVLMQLNHSLID